MSWISSALGKVKDGVVGAGHAVGKIASNPVVEGLGGMALGSGVGTLLGAAGGAMKPGGGLSGAVKGAGQGYLSGVAGQAAGGLLGSGAAALGGVGLPGIGAAGGFLKDHLGSIVGAAKGALGGGGDDGSGLDGTGLPTGDYSIDPLTMGLAGAGMANAAALGKKSNDFADTAWNSVNNDWQARAGMRSQGIADATALAKPRNVDTSSLSAIRAQAAPSMTNGPTLGTRAPV